MYSATTAIPSGELRIAPAVFSNEDVFAIVIIRRCMTDAIKKMATNGRKPRTSTGVNEIRWNKSISVIDEIPDNAPSSSTEIAVCAISSWPEEEDDSRGDSEVVLFIAVVVGGFGEGPVGFSQGESEATVNSKAYTSAYGGAKVVAAISIVVR